jgi:hypothetical protein
MHSMSNFEGLCAFSNAWKHRLDRYVTDVWAVRYPDNCSLILCSDAPLMVETSIKGLRNGIKTRIRGMILDCCLEYDIFRSLDGYGGNQKDDIRRHCRRNLVTVQIDNRTDHLCSRTFRDSEQEEDKDADREKDCIFHIAHNTYESVQKRDVWRGGRDLNPRPLA